MRERNYAGCFVLGPFVLDSLFAGGFGPGSNCVSRDVFMQADYKDQKTKGKKLPGLIIPLAQAKMAAVFGLELVEIRKHGGEGGGRTGAAAAAGGTQGGGDGGGGGRGEGGGRTGGATAAGGAQCGVDGGKGEVEGRGEAGQEEQQQQEEHNVGWQGAWGDDCREGGGGERTLAAVGQEQRRDRGNSRTWAAAAAGKLGGGEGLESVMGRRRGNVESGGMQ